MDHVQIHRGRDNELRSQIQRAMSLVWAGNCSDPYFGSFSERTSDLRESIKYALCGEGEFYEAHSPGNDTFNDGQIVVGMVGAQDRYDLAVESRRA